ncbi:Apyrase [Ancylostoma ceylanicum]|uniref:Apyrase n=1 Tax=Ancylostoma ceylanicum TaxID=53326 RepID=A0A0D6LUC1_9BILA|nr:Apyrase [Ancylostoma ceylanicum]
MDVAARAPDWQFRAITRKGTLNLSNDKKTAQMDWDLSSDRDIMSGFSYKGRGMELSDITEYNGHILSPDDKTGILFEIKNDKVKALPWVILNAGPGNTTKGMKTEWLTIKRSFLYAGGHGVEYRDDKGVVFSEDQMWIKVRSVNWKDAYVKVREYAGIKAPGYMTHEAVQWSDIHNRGTNLLITADERFNTFDIVRVGPLDHPERGFSAFAFVPGTNDEIIVALKSEEIDGRAPESYVTVFDIHGQILMEDQKLGNHYKFEGIFFL